MMHICMFTSSGNGLLPEQCQAITWPNDDLLSIECLGTWNNCNGTKFIWWCYTLQLSQIKEFDSWLLIKMMRNYVKQTQTFTFICLKMSHMKIIHEKSEVLRQEVASLSLENIHKIFQHVSIDGGNGCVPTCPPTIPSACRMTIPHVMVRCTMSFLSSNFLHLRLAHYSK